MSVFKQNKLNQEDISVVTSAFKYYVQLPPNNIPALNLYI